MTTNSNHPAIPAGEQDERQEFEAWLYLDQTLGDPDDMNKTEIDLAREAFSAGLRKAAPAAGDAQDDPTLQKLFEAAIRELAAISEHLGLDPEDGGAEPIIDAINALRSERDQWVDAQYAVAGEQNERAVAFGDEPHVLVPIGLLSAACSAIDKKRDAPKTLAELRRYTTGDLSSRHVPAAGDALDAARYRALHWIAADPSRFQAAVKAASLSDGENYTPEKFDALADAAIAAQQGKGE